MEKKDQNDIEIMDEKKINIWESFNFNDRIGKSVYDYIVSLNDSFISKTGGVLELYVQSRNGSDFNVIHDVYVVVESLGGYRKLIFTVMENDRINYFPVNILSIGLTDKSFCFVEEKDFIETIGEMISLSPIKRSIENLYQQAKSNL